MSIKDIAMEIRRKRRELDLSRADLAERSGLPVYYIKAIETEKMINIPEEKLELLRVAMSSMFMGMKETEGAIDIDGGKGESEAVKKVTFSEKFAKFPGVDEVIEMATLYLSRYNKRYMGA